ncbi:MAG: hypothetical protein FWE08_01310 [Oscillospiraceae bacterium]|nr:hypothetical protein [Oscillospiraceae bacterium]
MIMPWNRHEVYCGSSVEKFNEILDTLMAHDIKYQYRIDGRGQAGRGSMGRGAIMKYIYVHKKDMDRLPKL